MSFEAGPANQTPGSITLFASPGEASANLPQAATIKMIQLHQRVVDAHSATIPFSQIHELAETKVRHAQRIGRLVMRRAEGGFGLDENSPQVVEERKKLERVEAELARLNALNEIRMQRWTVLSQLERVISDWLLRGGIPANCALETVEDAPIGELLKKGERFADAVERYRHRLRECAADRHRVKSAPHPSSVAKIAATAQIDALAEAGAPDCESCIEHGSPINFATVTMQSLVRNVDAPAVGFAELPNALGLLCWTFHDEILRKIHTAIDEVADDKNALAQPQREQIEAQIALDEMMIARSECALIWAAEAAGEIIDWRVDTPPLPLLGLRLINQPPRTNGGGTSPEHVVTIAGERRRR